MTTEAFTPKTHILTLLDRCGSMRTIADDVIGGFNTFLAAQQADGNDARITLVQFDSQDPQEVLLAGVPIAAADPLSPEQFQPRGGTPLLDATGRLIERARLEADLRGANGLPKEDIVIVSITDGQENQSREYTVERIRQLIAGCEADGWTFVFLSASIKAYHEAGTFVIREDLRYHFANTSAGTRSAMYSHSDRMIEFRDKKRRGVAMENDDIHGQ
jgi:Mg-chelatase subunit ChlD